MARCARDRLADSEERQRKLSSGEMAPWKIHSAWDPWQMKVGGEGRVNANGAKTVARYIASVAETHPVLEAHQSDRKQRQISVTLHHLLIQTQIVRPL